MALRKTEIFGWPSQNAKKVFTAKNWDHAHGWLQGDKANRVVEAVQEAWGQRQECWERSDWAQSDMSKPMSFKKGPGKRWLNYYPESQWPRGCLADTPTENCNAPWGKGTAGGYEMPFEALKEDFDDFMEHKAKRWVGGGSAWKKEKLEERQESFNAVIDAHNASVSEPSKKGLISMRWTEVNNDDLAAVIAGYPDVNFHHCNVRHPPPCCLLPSALCTLPCTPDEHNISTTSRTAQASAMRKGVLRAAAWQVQRDVRVGHLMRALHLGDSSANEKQNHWDQMARDDTDVGVLIKQVVGVWSDGMLHEEELLTKLHAEGKLKFDPIDHPNKGRVEGNPPDPDEDVLDDDFKEDED